MNRSRQKNWLIKNSAMLIALVMLWIPAQAQVVKTMTFNSEDGEIFMLPEVGGIIVESDDGPKVEMVLPSDQRPENYKAVDIQAGDIIKMFNGKSMKTVALIKETYEALGIGDQLKFGIRRDKSVLMIKFIKMDPKDARGRMMVKTISMSDDGETDNIIAGNIITDLIDLGLLLEKKDGIIFVADVITEVSTAFKGTQPENGDQLIKIQSSKISSPKELTQIYDKIKAGEKVDLTVLRSGEEVILTFEKPESVPGSKSFKVMKKQGH